MKRLTDDQLQRLIKRALYGDGQPMKAVSYGRVSSEAQTHGTSLDGQAFDIKEHAEQHSISIVHHYDERGESAWRGERPQFHQLLNDLPHWTKQGVQYVYVYHLDRFARNTRYGLDALERLRAHGVALISVVGMVDYSTPEGWKTLIERLAAAEYYSHNLSRVIKDTRRRQTLRNQQHTALPPTGYSRVDGQLIPNDDRDVIRIAASTLIATRCSLPKLAEHLNTAGLKVYNAQLKQHVPVTAAALRDMLINPIYIGKLRYKGETVAGNHEPLLSLDQWAAVQAILNERRNPRGARVTKSDRLFTGLIRCIHCGSVMWQHRVTSNGASYRCPNRETKRCSALPVNERMIEHHMLHILGTLAIPSAWHGSILDQARTMVVEQPTQPHTTPQVNPQLERLLDLYLTGGIDKPTYLARKAQLEALPVGTSTQPASFDTVQALAWLRNLRGLYQQSPVHLQRALLQALLAEVYVERFGGIIALVPRQPYLELLNAVTNAALGGFGEPGGDRTPLLPRLPSIWAAYFKPIGHNIVA